MKRQTTDTSASNLRTMRTVHQDLLQKALHMRCVSYLADAKAQLLIQTVTTVGRSKRLAMSNNRNLRDDLRSVRREVEARRRVERQLREITDAVEQAPVMVLIGRAGGVVYVNEASRARFGSDTLRGSLFDVLNATRHSEDAPVFSPELLPWAGDLQMRFGEAETPWLRVSVAQGDQGDSKRPHFVAILEDISREREAKLRLERSQRLEALGQLVGGVAHDFNNMLMAITTNLQLLDEVTEEERAQLLREALEATAQGGQLTRQLLAFARRQVLSPKRVDVPELVDRVVSMLRRTIGERHPLEVQMAPELSAASCDPAQLESALLNLILNARDACSSGAAIAVQLGMRRVDAPVECGPGELPAGDFVSISVVDCGTGIPADLRDRIWEPFVSTKDGDKHSGLGLSMVFGFVEQSGGAIETADRAAQGTRVTMYLPVS